jgi:hypothetical protein
VEEATCHQILDGSLKAAKVASWHHLQHSTHNPADENVPARFCVCEDQPTAELVHTTKSSKLVALFAAENVLASRGMVKVEPSA